MSIYLFIYLWKADIQVPGCMCGCQINDLELFLSFSHVDPGIELRLLGLVVRTNTPKASYQPIIIYILLY